MGTDISVVIEYKDKSDDKWTGTTDVISCIDFYDERMEAFEDKSSLISWVSKSCFEARVPILFYILCGRITGNLAWHMHKKPGDILLPKTIASEPRGMPKDASVHSLFYLVADNQYNVKHSYVTLDELSEYDWENEKVNVPGYSGHENTSVSLPVDKHEFLAYLKIISHLFEGRDARLVFAFDQ